MTFAIRTMYGIDPEEVATRITAFLAAQPLDLVIRGLDFHLRDNQKVTSTEVVSQLFSTLGGNTLTDPFSLEVYSAPTRESLDYIFNTRSAAAPDELFYPLAQQSVITVGRKTTYYLPVIHHPDILALDNILIGGGHNGGAPPSALPPGLLASLGDL